MVEIKKDLKMVLTKGDIILLQKMSLLQVCG